SITVEQAGAGNRTKPLRSGTPPAARTCFPIAKNPNEAPAPLGRGLGRGDVLAAQTLRSQLHPDWKDSKRSAPSPGGEGWGEGTIHPVAQTFRSHPFSDPDKSE